MEKELKIKQILQINSFYELVGLKQPDETCPIIDELIMELESKINSLKSMNPDDNESIESEILHLNDKIRYLNQDRSKIAEARQEGIAQRSFIINNLLLSFHDYNSFSYLNTKILFSGKVHLTQKDFPKLYTDYKPIINNYQLIIDWAIKWSQLVDTITEKILIPIIIVNFDEESWCSFKNTLPVINNIFNGTQEIDLVLLKNIQNFSPNSIVNSQLNALILWEECFPHLNPPIKPIFEISQ